MSSRKEQKEQLRAEREERERQEQDDAAKQARRLRLVIAVGGLLVLGVVIAFVAAGGGGDSEGEAQEGLQETAGPWPPLSEGVQDRQQQLDLPPPSDTIYHVHAQLKVFLNGRPSTVPNNIGIDQGAGFLSSLHTHDEKGIMHLEAVEPYPFTVSQFFTMWGVKFSPTQIGSFRVGNGLVLEGYVNGKKVPDITKYQMKQGDAVVVAFGKPGSAPKTFKTDPAVSSP